MVRPQRVEEPRGASAPRTPRPSTRAAPPAPSAIAPRRPAGEGTAPTARERSAGASGGRATPRGASRSSGRLTGGDDHVLDDEPAHQDEDRDKRRHGRRRLPDDARELERQRHHDPDDDRPQPERDTIRSGDEV